MGLKDFFKKRPDIKDVAHIETLGNGVVRVEMPRNAFNSKAWWDTVKAGRPGGKTLFPQSWNMRKIFEAINEVIKDIDIPITGRASFEKIVDGIKIRVNTIDEKVITSYPIWIQ